MNTESTMAMLKTLSEEFDKLGLVITIMKKPKNKRDFVMYCSPDLVFYNSVTNATVVPKFYGAINLRERREALGFNQRKMAIELGYDHNIVARLENDTYPHNRKYMLRLSEYFKCPISDFLVDEGERESERERERGGERG